MPRIAEETIQRVAEANDIVEVIGSYFPLKRAGTSFRALCPFHREKSPSFHVNPQRQSYHCFGCGAGGTIFRFIMEYEHVDFPDAVRKLAHRAGIPIVEEEGSAEEDDRHRLRKRLLALHADASAWFHQNLLKSPLAQPARDYLKARGITAEVAKSWQLGYAPDSWDAMLDLLREKKFSSEEIQQSGLTSWKEDEEGPQKVYARFRGRVMFPIRNDYGEVIAFSGRVLDADAKTAKYVNSPETPLFTKGRVLYGMDKSKRALIEAKTAIVCEGQLDLISAFESGVQNVIAPQGTAFTPEQARMLQRFVETVVLCFDSDRAGQEAVARSLPALLGCGLEVKVARLPEGEDPDSLIRGQGAEAFRTVIDASKNFFDHALDILAAKGSLDDPNGKSSAARRLGPYVAAIKDTVLRETTAKKICARLGISEDAFATHIKRSDQPSAAPDETRKEAIAPLVLSQGLNQLCRLGIMHPESRAWLKEQTNLPWESLGEGQGLLKKILNSSLALETPASQAAFVSELSAQEEVTIANLDLERMPEEPLERVKDLVTGLIAQQSQERNKQAKSLHLDPKKSAGAQQIKTNLSMLRERLKIAEARLKDTVLETRERQGQEEVVENLTKQILDLESRVNEV